MKCLYCKRKAGLYGVCAKHYKILNLLHRVGNSRKPKNQRTAPLTQ